MRTSRSRMRPGRRASTRATISAATRRRPDVASVAAAVRRSASARGPAASVARRSSQRRGQARFVVARNGRRRRASFARRPHRRQCVGLCIDHRRTSLHGPPSMAAARLRRRELRAARSPSVRLPLRAHASTRCDHAHADADARSPAVRQRVGTAAKRRRCDIKEVRPLSAHGANLVLCSRTRQQKFAPTRISEPQLAIARLASC